MSYDRLGVRDAIAAVLRRHHPNWTPETLQGYGSALVRLPAGDRALIAGLLAPEGNGRPAPDPGEDRGPLFVSLADLNERPELLEPPTFAIPRLACLGRTTIFAGPDKKGKSSFLGQAIAMKSRGRSFLGDPTPAGRILWLGIEEALGDAVRRFKDHDADPANVFLAITRPPDPYLELRNALDTLAPDVVVIDSLIELGRAMLGKSPESGDSAGWGSVVRPIVGLSHEYGTAFLITHHTKKSDGSYRDSSEIGAAPDMVVTMRLAGPKEHPNLRHISGEGRWPFDSFTVQFEDGRYRMSGGAEVSLDALLVVHIQREPGISANRLRELVGRKNETVLEALTLLENRGAVIQQGTGRFKGYVIPSPQYDPGDS